MQKTGDHPEVSPKRLRERGCVQRGGQGDPKEGCGGAQEPAAVAGGREGAAHQNLGL